MRLFLSALGCIVSFASLSLAGPVPEPAKPTLAAPFIVPYFGTFDGDKGAIIFSVTESGPDVHWGELEIGGVRHVIEVEEMVLGRFQLTIHRGLDKKAPVIGRGEVVVIDGQLVGSVQLDGSKLRTYFVAGRVC